MANCTGKELSAEIVVSIVDLLTEIHLRLPIKSLIRFKQVSKHWQSLISNPGFVIRRNPTPNPAAGIFVPMRRNSVNVTTNLRYAYVSFSKQKSTTKKINFNIEEPHVFNGLLLCYNFGNGTYFVYNPTTNKSSTIPESRDESKTKVLGMRLAFDPAKSRHYKIICARWLDSFEMYSSETGSWRKLDGLVTGLYKFLNNGVYWNGAIHWIDYTTGSCLYFNLDDIVDDRVVELCILSPREGEGGVYYFGESCGHLSYVEFFRTSGLANVYELRKDYSEWFVKYVIDLSPVYEALDKISGGIDDERRWFYSFSSTTLVRGEKDEDSFLVVVLSPKVIVRYNFVQGTCETI